jgi:hypothetical protein
VSTRHAEEKVKELSFEFLVRGVLAVVLASLLAPPQARAEQPTTVSFTTCKETKLPARPVDAKKKYEAYLRECIQGWLPKHIAASAGGLKPSGKGTITAYASQGDGAACGPNGEDEGGEVWTRFIALVPVTGDEGVSHLVFKVETTLSFCHEKAGTRLGGTINKATTIR